MIKFESCPGLRKTTPQEISVHNMIAYKDAFRLNISLGDKVLAPWQDDGRYGPGTVLDGYERRNTQYEGKLISEIIPSWSNYYRFLNGKYFYRVEFNLTLCYVYNTRYERPCCVEHCRAEGK